MTRACGTQLRIGALGAAALLFVSLGGAVLFEKSVFGEDEKNDIVSLPHFVRGDANGDHEVDISDSVWTVSYLFLGGPEPVCAAAADANDDERVDISDIIVLLLYLFVTGDPLPAPGSSGPGPDPTPGLPCMS